jgi:prepilin-type N-terminal cleavage/methylation domain-containing protein
MHIPETVLPARPERRRGFTFVEILAASAMLAVLLGLMAQIMAQSKRQVAAIERNAKALVVLENAMELATALPWDDVDDELAAKLPIADDLTQRWPGAELACKVTESSDPVPSKQITLTLRTSAAARPATLTTWIYRTPAPQEEQP